MKKRAAGFTLVEIIVVVGLIAILSAMVYANFGQGSAQSRDAERKADLQLVQNALELYKQENGRYPAGCNGANWSGESSYAYKCPGSDTQYIVGLAPKYLSVLPKDPKKGVANSDYGYVYRTNAAGTVYKFVARESVETETVDYDSEFSPCDVVTVSSNLGMNIGGGNYMACPASTPSYITANEERNMCAYAICNNVNSGAGLNCQSANGYNDIADYNDCLPANISHSYAVWGGYSNPDEAVSNLITNDLKVECFTEKVLCDMPAATGWNP
jgi:prepilin-type N-terminal cleavage/methylation domain-containing protein